MAPVEDTSGAADSDGQANIRGQGAIGNTVSLPSWSSEPVLLHTRGICAGDIGIATAGARVEPQTHPRMQSILCGGNSYSEDEDEDE